MRKKHRQYSFLPRPKRPSMGIGFRNYPRVFTRYGLFRNPWSYGRRQPRMQYGLMRGGAVAAAQQMLKVVMPLIVCISCFGCGTGFGLEPTTNKIVLPPKTEAMFLKVDKMAESIPVLLENTQKILDTPAGKLIPTPVKGIIGIGALSLQGLALWYLNIRKNIFKTGFNELAMANELFYVNNSTDKTKMMDAESRSINPPTLKLMQKEGFRRRIINE